jgi:hypothetical protein
MIFNIIYGKFDSRFFIGKEFIKKLSKKVIKKLNNRIFPKNRPWVVFFDPLSRVGGF